MNARSAPAAGAHILAPDSLARVLCLAGTALGAVRQGRSLNDGLAQAFASSRDMPAAAVKGAVQDLAFFGLRYRARADALLARLSSRPADPAVIGEILCLALVLLERQGEADTPHYAPHTLINQAVDAAGAMVNARARRAVAGFANAVLRRALTRPADVFLTAAADSPEALNYPQWWINEVRRAYPQEWRDILAVGQHKAPMTLRVNLRRISLHSARERLARAGIAAQPLSASSLLLEKARPVDTIEGFREGFYSVQDEAAQRAAPLLDLKAGGRVLDACAAPGGKSGHILELADVRLTALDSDATRLSRVRENLERLGFEAKLVCGDASLPAAWWDGVPFDRILADLPCTASGIVRRHPDIRWLRRLSDLDSLSLRQQHILQALWRLLAANGKLLVVTCSIFPQEGADLVSRFCAHHADARLLAGPGQLLPVARADENHDGLFYGLIEKVA